MHVYKASLGLVGVAGVALLIGWLKQSNPATWVSISAATLAGILLIASAVRDRRRSRGGVAVAGSGGEQSLGTWTPHPGSAPSASSYSPSETAESAPSSTVAMPAVAAESATAAEEPARRRRFGRKAVERGAGAAEQEDAVTGLQALSESASAQLESLAEEEPETAEVLSWSARRGGGRPQEEEEPAVEPAYEEPDEEPEPAPQPATSPAARSVSSPAEPLPGREAEEEEPTAEPPIAPWGEPSERVSPQAPAPAAQFAPADRKSTRLNSSHDQISYAVFCLKKKKKRRPL